MNDRGADERDREVCRDDCDGVEIGARAEAQSAASDDGGGEDFGG